MLNRRIRLFCFATIAVAAGMCFQVGGCSPSGVLNYVSNINPCGTILDCDPNEYRFATSGYDGPGVDTDVTLYCTYPPFCPPDQDPMTFGIQE